MLTNDKNLKPYEDYFVPLGYEISWDYSRKLGESWFEIYLNDELLLQIDYAPLEAIIADFISFHTGEPTKSTYNKPYKICGEENEDTKELYRKIYEKELNKFI